MKGLKEENKKKLLGLFEPFFIGLIWTLIFISPILRQNSDLGFDWLHIFNAWRGFAPFLILFLVSHYVLLPLLFFRNRKFVFFICVGALIGLLWAGDVYVKQTFGLQQNRNIILRPQQPRTNFGPTGPDQMRPPLRRPLLDKPPNQLPPIVSFIVVSILIVGFDIGLRLYFKWIYLEQKRMISEKENVKTQLAFLRNQVNPHFFMNTLNNIHSLIDINTDEAKESIIRLSKLMRHLLYETEAERIPIKKEIEFIYNYVDLMRMRYSDKVKIDVHLNDRIPDRLIPPLLFTSFVENAFKHGISYQIESFVEIVFSFTDKTLIFEVSNSVPENRQKDEASGIGIENSRKRLDLIYGDEYSLNIQEFKNKFTLNLTIPL